MSSPASLAAFGAALFVVALALATIVAPALADVGAALAAVR